MTPREAFEHVSEDAKKQIVMMTNSIDAHLLHNYGGEEKFVYETQWDNSHILPGVLDIVCRLYERCGWGITTVVKKKALMITFYNQELIELQKENPGTAEFCILPDEVADAVISELYKDEEEFSGKGESSKKSTRKPGKLKNPKKKRENKW
jgi:hypothetical protein